MDVPKTDKVERVLVHVRVRPFSEGELADQELAQTSIIGVSENPPSIVVRKDYDKKAFHFDSVLDGTTSQEDIYKQTAHSVIEVTSI